MAVGLLKKSKVQPPPVEGSVGLSEKSKVQPPPVGGSVGLSEKSKVQGGGVQILGGGWYKVTLVLHLNLRKFTVNCQAPYFFTPFLHWLSTPPPVSPPQTSLEGATDRFGPGGWAVIRQSSSIKAKPGQGRDCQAPELVLGHQLVAHLCGKRPDTGTARKWSIRERQFTTGK